MFRVLLVLAMDVWLSSVSRGGWEIEFDQSERFSILPNQDAEIAGDLGNPLHIDWNVKGVEQGTRFDSARAVCGPSQTAETGLERSVCLFEMGTWSQRSKGSVEPQPFDHSSRGVAQTSLTPPTDMTWLADAVWPLTRSHIGNGRINDEVKVFSFFMAISH